MALVRSSLLLLFTLSGLLVCAQDTVYFKSGERVLGELKSLDMGKMKVDNDEMGIVNIDWEDVSGVRSVGLFEITLKDRTKHFGYFDVGDSLGQIILVEDDGNRLVLDPMTVVSVGELETKFWAKIDGSVDAGLSFTKASQVLQYNGGFRLAFRDKKWFTQLSASFVITEQEAKATARKSNANYDLRYAVIKRWFVGLALGTEQNTELGLDRRFNVGAGIGNDFVYTNVHKLYGMVGFNSNLERALDNDTIKTSAEGAIAAGYLLYNSGVKDFYLDINAILYPSFTVTNRVRGEININPKIEIVKDLDFGLQYYYIFDTNPVLEGASTEDYGILTTIAYSF